MQRIPFPLECYEHPSYRRWSPKRLINADGRAAAGRRAHHGGHGLDAGGCCLGTAAAGGSGRDRQRPDALAMNDDMPQGRIYIVSGANAYRLYFGDRGRRGGGRPRAGRRRRFRHRHIEAAFVTIAAGPTAAVIVQPNAYTVLPDDQAPAQPDHRPGFSRRHVGLLLHRPAVSSSRRWATPPSGFISLLLDPTSYDALDFVFSDAMPNVICRVFSHREQVWDDRRRRLLRSGMTPARRGLETHAGYRSFRSAACQGRRRAGRRRLADVGAAGLRQVGLVEWASMAWSTARTATRNRTAGVHARHRGDHPAATRSGCMP